MSNSPETDAFKQSLQRRGTFPPDEPFDFASKRERERDAGRTLVVYLKRDLDIVTEQRDEARRERDVANAESAKYSIQAGSAEGKLLASELHGVVEGWKIKCDALRAELDAVKKDRDEAQAAKQMKHAEMERHVATIHALQSQLTAAQELLRKSSVSRDALNVLWTAAQQANTRLREALEKTRELLDEIAEDGVEFPRHLRANEARRLLPVVTSALSNP